MPSCVLPRLIGRRLIAALLPLFLLLWSAQAGAQPAAASLQRCTLEDVSPGPGSTPAGNASRWGKMLSLSTTGLERAVGPATAWSSVNGGVTVDHLAAADDRGNLLLFYSSNDSDWKAVDVTEKTGRTIAVVRPESWLFAESPATTLERVAAPSVAGDLLLYTWSSGHDWTVENLSTTAATKITGPVTAWSTTLDGTAVEHIAARSTSDRLLVFWRLAGGSWAAVDVTSITGLSVGGPPTSWAYHGASAAWTERLAAPSPTGDQLLFTFTPSTDWTATNLTTTTHQKVAGPGVDWIAPSGTPIEYLAARAANGDLVIFHTEPIENTWGVLNVTAITGQRVDSVGTFWAVPVGSAWWEHVAALGADGHVYVFHRPTNGTWAVVDVTNATGQAITQVPCSWTTTSGNGRSEHLAAPSWDGHLHNFLFAAGSWTTADISVKAQGRTIFAASERAGIWKSADYGRIWSQLARAQPAPGASTTSALDVPFVLDQAVSPKDPRIIVAGTGTDLRTKSLTGIYRSPDGGITWSLVHQIRCGSTVQPIAQVIFAPDDPETLYAAGGCAVAISHDSGSTWDDLVPPGIPGGSRVWHVAVSPLLPGDQRRAFACGDGMVWYSHDSGSHWYADTGASGHLPDGACAVTTIGNGDAAQVLAIEPGAPNRVYLAHQNLANGPSYFHPADGGGDGVHCNNPVVYDTNGDGKVDAGDTSVWGLQPVTGDTLLHDPRIRYVDTNGNGHWDGGEPVVHDLDANKVYGAVAGMVDTNEPVLTGKTPAAGTALLDDPKLKHVSRGTAFGWRGCGEGSLWYGDASSFDPAHPGSFDGTWTQLPGPPVFWGQTGSGAAFVRTHATKTGYLVFFADQDTLNVSDGKPSEGSWHRLDGWDPSVNQRSNNLNDVMHVHVDPHGLAISSDFSLTLKAVRDVPKPYNMNRELASCGGGRLWLANDGGVYRTDDCGQTWTEAEDGLHTLAVINVAGVARTGGAPGLYFGTGDNDDFHSIDGGQTYKTSMDGCGDCGVWFADAAEPGRVLASSRSIKGVFGLYESSSGNPDPASGQLTVPAPTAAGAESTNTVGGPGYRPIIQTLARESAPTHGDFIVIQEYKMPGMTAVRRLMRANSPQSWTAPWAVEADLPSNDITVVQAAGGHASPTYYVGDTVGLWRGARNASTGKVGWTQVVPGGGATVARKFFANPYDSAEIYIVDDKAVRRSSDSGATWTTDSALDSVVTDGGLFSYSCGTGALNFDDCVLTEMVFDRQSPKTRFAAGVAGVFESTDGLAWTRLVDARAMPSRPAGLYYDAVGTPSRPSLYIAFLGRGLVRCQAAAPGRASASPQDMRTVARAGRLELGGLESWAHTGAVDMSAERRREGHDTLRLGGRLHAMAEISRTIEVPADAGPVALSFWWYIQSRDAQPAADVLRVTARVGRDRSALAAISNSDAQGRWVQATVSLDSYRGRPVTVTLRAEENGKDPTFFYLDDIRLIWGGELRH